MTGPRLQALLLVATYLVFAHGCDRVQQPHTVADAQALVRAAIEAQGGYSSLARLDDVRIISRGRFKGALPFVRTIDYRAPDTWAMSIAFADDGIMRFGMAGDRCWRSERHLTAVCSDSDQSENHRIAALHTARLLHRIDPATVQPAGTVSCGSVTCPAVRVGEVVLGFDPTTHVLVQVGLENRIDTLSDYRDLGGVRVATHRVLTIAGELDCDETWTDITPGGADPQALRPPELPRAGLIVDQTDDVRLVAWTSIGDPARNLAATIERLRGFVQAHGRRMGSADGVMLSGPAADVSASGWRLAVGVEGGAALQAVSDDDFHLESWPSTRILGVFYGGDPVEFEAPRATLDQAMHERGVVPVPGARWQMLYPLADLDRAPADRLSFLRIAVQ